MINLKNIKCVLLLCATILFAKMEAQTQLPAKCEVSCPAELTQPIVETSITNKVEKNNGGEPSSKHWDVYSDRENNITYNSPSSSSGAFSSLTFNEPLRIAKIEGGFALVYTEPNKSVSYPQISPKAVSKGWVPMKNLLLWHYCPVDEKKIYNKALLVVNLDNAPTSKDELFNIYRQPGTQGTTIKASTNNIFFIMKEANGFLLLSSQASLEGASSQVLVGWVKNSSCVKWNQRSCLEPNWNREDVEGQLANKQVNIYETSSMSGNGVAHWKYGDFRNVDDKNPASHYRMPAQAFRFPILNNDTGNKNIFKCTTFANASGSLEIASRTAAGARKNLDYAQERARNINLIIVIDGTRSMEQFYPAVKQAIKSGLAYFDKNKYNIKVGVVIYRDKADGKYIEEHLAMQPVGSSIIDAFLDKGGEYGVKSSSTDKTNEEDLFYGMDVALNTGIMKYNKNHSNMMLLVGDCGNLPDDARQEQIVKKLIENNIQLFTFQVYNPGGGAWNIFRSQTASMMKNNLDTQYKSLLKDKSIQPGKFAQVREGRDYQANFSDDVQFFAGALRYPQQGQLAPAHLTKLMEEKIGVFADAIQKQVDKYTIDIATINDNGGIEATMSKEFLKQKLGSEVYDMIYKNGATVAMTGYTAMADAGGTAYWIPVVFISSDEFSKLMSSLLPVYNIAKERGNDREPYIRALAALVKTMVPEADTGKMTQNEITGLMAGLNVQTNAMRDKSFTLDEIKNTTAVPHTKYLAILKSFKDKYEKLKEIHNSYLYKMKFNGLEYFWIPIEDLP